MHTHTHTHTHTYTHTHTHTHTHTVSTAVFPREPKSARCRLGDTGGGGPTRKVTLSFSVHIGRFLKSRM